MNPPPRDLVALLNRVRASVAAGRLRLSDYARDRARVELGWEQWDSGEELRDLTEADWHRCDTSHDRPWEIIWTFTPPFTNTTRKSFGSASSSEMVCWW